MFDIFRIAFEFVSQLLSKLIDDKLRSHKRMLTDAMLKQLVAETAGDEGGYQNIGVEQDFQETRSKIS